MALLIVGVLAPSAAVAAAAAHELFEHGYFAAIDDASAAALFHGHRHRTGEPDHDHALVKPPPAAKAVDRLPELQIGCKSHAAVAAPDLVALSFGLERPAVATGSGPPPGISPLRV